MRSLIGMIFMVFLLASQADAEFYRYTDEDGNLRYTDDLGMVPPDQRTGALEYEGYESVDGSRDMEVDEQQAEEQESEPRDPGSGGEEQAGQEYDFEAVYKELEQTRAELEAEYNSMVEERDLLTVEPEGEMTKEQSGERNRKIQAFNERVKAYQQKKQDFEHRRAEYNERAIEAMEKTIGVSKSRADGETVSE